ncbi:MAG: hypothetical protein KDB23_05865, partial [Planctomycetales bacterium]|nr:hypothetical protein [Planctomycetales bacterium]
MLQIVLAYNFVLLGCDLFAAFLYARYRHPTVVVLCSMVWLLAATLLAFYLGRMTFSSVLLLSYAMFLHAPIN